MRIPFTSLAAALQNGKLALTKEFTLPEILELLKNYASSSVSGLGEKIILSPGFLKRAIFSAEGLLPSIQKAAEAKSMEKEASILDALKGAGLAGAGITIPAALRAYALDHDIDKDVMHALAYALPAGALLGGVGLPASRSLKSIAGSVDELVNTAKSMAGGIGGAAAQAADVKRWQALMNNGNIQQAMQYAKQYANLWKDAITSKSPEAVGLFH